MPSATMTTASAIVTTSARRSARSTPSLRHETADSRLPCRVFGAVKHAHGRRGAVHREVRIGNRDHDC